MTDNFIHSSRWRAIRTEVMAHEDTCYLCGKPVDKRLRNGPMAPSVDHVIARATGGDMSSMENLHLVHRICNSKKGDLTLEEFRMRQARSQENSRDWFHM